MFSNLIPMAIAVYISLVNNVALAENLLPPIPDAKGNYDSIWMRTLERNYNEEQLLWRVITPGLNCRENPGLSNKIIRQFKQGDIINARSIGRGGADEANPIQLAPDGKPWLRIKIGEYDGIGKYDDCYVRANSRYLAPH
jgi:hypothetical protein